MSASTETKTETFSSKSNHDDSDLLDKIWLVRPCEMYIQEFTECTSKEGRKHQMYIYGRHMDCSKWEEDKINCLKYRNERDNSAAIKIIEHELMRREKRLAAAKNNDVWEYRTGPPDDWEKPLPGSDKKDTRLTVAQRKLEKAEGNPDAMDKGKSCVIS